MGSKPRSPYSPYRRAAPRRSPSKNPSRNAGMKPVRNPTRNQAPPIIATTSPPVLSNLRDRNVMEMSNPASMSKKSIGKLRLCVLRHHFWRLHSRQIGRFMGFLGKGRNIPRQAAHSVFLHTAQTPPPSVPSDAVKEAPHRAHLIKRSQ